MFNQQYIMDQFRIQHQNEQMIRSFECAKKLEDFMDSMDKVEPEYQRLAFEQCCEVFAKYMRKHNMI